MNIFHILLTQPLFNALIVLYETIALRDFGVAIILLTIFVRLLLFPIFHQTIKHQRAAQELQPEIKKIREKHKEDREAQTKALMELYQKHRVNPFTPLALLLVQLPVLFALYRIFINGFGEETLLMLYPFVPTPGALNQTLLGIVELGAVSIPLVVAATLAQYAQGRLAIARSKKGGGKEARQAEKIGRALVFAGPAVTLIILVRFPAALALYWLTSTIFSIIQQVIVNKSIEKNRAGNSGKDK